MQTLAAVAMMMLPAACADDYDDSALWDKVNDHEERLAALEKWQEQTNQSIAAMQELLNTTDMITGVSAVDWTEPTGKTAKTEPQAPKARKATTALPPPRRKSCWVATSLQAVPSRPTAARRSPMPGT